MSKFFFSFPDDKNLPDFDPKSFTPGKAPPIVKQGENEYMIVVSGVKDTGLCGKYWADIDNLPPRRRRTGGGSASKINFVFPILNPLENDMLDKFTRFRHNSRGLPIGT